MDLWEFEALAWVVIWILPIMLGGVFGAVIGQSKGMQPYEGAAVVITLDLIMRGVGWIVQEVGAPVAGFAISISGALLGIFILSLIPRRVARTSSASDVRSQSRPSATKQPTTKRQLTNDEEEQQRWRRERIERLKSPADSRVATTQRNLQRERERLRMLRDGASPAEVFLETSPLKDEDRPHSAPPARTNSPVQRMLATPARERAPKKSGDSTPGDWREAELHQLELESALFDVRQQRKDAEKELKGFQTLKELIDERKQLEQVQDELARLRKEFDTFSSSVPDGE